MNEDELKRTAPRPPFWVKVSIVLGNLLQIAGLAAGVWALYLAAYVAAGVLLRLMLLILGWLVIYISGHSLAHWLVGRIMGIRFVEYGVRGTDHPETLSPVMRAILSRLPMFTAITDKESMQKASPVAKALMFAAGETSTILGVLLIGLYAWRNNLPGGWLVLIVSVLMSVTGVISTTRMPRGDYAKAIRALRGH